MKKLILAGLTVLLFAACQEKEQRYFSESSEINTLKAGIASYEAGDWTTWKGHFADTAKIYVNSDKSISVDARVTNLQEMSSAFSKYGFDKEEEFIEMVLDKEKETWVYYWAQHNATIAANNKQLSNPVHLAVQFIDGKIVEEHVFFDATEMNKEIDAFANLSTGEKAIMSGVGKLVKSWNTKDLAMFKSVTDDNFVRNTNGVTEARNQEEYTDMMGVFHTAFPDFKVAINDYFVKDGKAHLNWTVTGTNTGVFMENAATGKKIRTHGYSILTFNTEGKGTREDAFFDNMELYTQLGYTVSPPK